MRARRRGRSLPRFNLPSHGGFTSTPVDVVVDVPDGAVAYLDFVENFYWADETRAISYFLIGTDAEEFDVENGIHISAAVTQRPVMTAAMLALINGHTWVAEIVPVSGFNAQGSNNTLMHVLDVPEEDMEEWVNQLYVRNDVAAKKMVLEDADSVFPNTPSNSVDPVQDATVRVCFTVARDNGGGTYTSLISANGSAIGATAATGKTTANYQTTWLFGRLGSTYDGDNDFIGHCRSLIIYPVQTEGAHATLSTIV